MDSQWSGYDKYKDKCKLPFHELLHDKNRELAGILNENQMTYG